jgi:S1-C subfamily serine protease
VGKAAVTIKVLASDGTVRSGSGFIVDPTGTVVTNVHVVEGAKHIEIHVSNGDVYEPSGVRVADTRRDIAVLQLAAFNLPTAKLADSDSVAPGDHVVVLGTALGVLENSVTSGIISGIRELEGSRLFQMDAAVSPGNSGGPVADDRGEVIGVTVSKITSGQSLNFAIPINYVRAQLTQPVQAGLAALATTPKEPRDADHTTAWTDVLTRQALDTGFLSRLPPNLSVLLGLAPHGEGVDVRQLLDRAGKIIRSFNVRVANHSDLVIVSVNPETGSTIVYLLGPGGTLRKALAYEAGGQARELTTADASRGFRYERRFWSDWAHEGTQAGR